MYKEGRFRMLTQSQPERAELLLAAAEAEVSKRWADLEAMASGNGKTAAPAAKETA
jgi:hypothetical protein